MAETIISPGVFTRENDLSFLPAGIGAIGAAIVGPTVKGPAFVPQVITRGFSEFERVFGPQHPETYVPFAVKEYLRNAGTVTVLRVLAGGGYKYNDTMNNAIAIVNNNPASQAGGQIISIIVPSKGNNLSDLNASTLTAASDGDLTPEANEKLALTLSGSSIAKTVISMSLLSTDSQYIERTLGTSARNSKIGGNTYSTGEGSAISNPSAKPAHLAIHFKNKSLSSSLDNEVLLLTGSVSASDFTNSTFTEGYDHAKTPMITSGYTNSPGTSTVDLFKFHTLADGTSTNKDFKISVTNLNDGQSDIDGVEQYATFTIQLRGYGDTDKAPTILEEYTNVNLNPDSPNYIARRIGDRFQSYNTTLGKVLTSGDYPNISQFIRVEVSEGVSEGSLSPKLSPRGFKAVTDPFAPFQQAPGGTVYRFPGATYRTSQQLSGTYNLKAYLGWDFSEKQNENWNRPVANLGQANVASGSSKTTNFFNVDDFSMHASASATFVGSLSASTDNTGTSGPRGKDLKFSVPFQGGNDGMSPAIIRQIGEYATATNVYGFNLSSTSATGYTAYKKALDILSNQDEYDINMLALPGVVKNLHAPVTDAAVTMAEDRQDTFYVMDLSTVNASVAQAVNDADGLDTNYAASYYPWVKVLDTSRNKPVFVPPSVIVPGAIAASDRIGAEWFAPAGLNRGVLGTVLEAKTRLNQAERDELYEGRVNPIATFPATGVCIWGQKTLQVRPTALDRINVRRLMIAVKKFIASSSKYLVFEQNTIQTRNRFLNIANPFLESVQQRQGLFAFRVTMDETNNTPDEIDRNRLIGAIFLQPAKTAEFIVLDFNILPTGATFGD